MDNPINKSPVNIQAIKKVVKLAVTRQVIVFAKVLFFRSTDIIYFSTHIFMKKFILLTLK